MRINHNISAINAWRALGQTDSAMTKSLERLSSGLRINRAADDAAGLAISEKMRGQIRGLNQAVRNAQDAISLIQTAEGALNETHAILQRMRELAVQAASDTNTDVDRKAIQEEIDQLAAELTRIANTTEFNTKKLLDGTFSGTFHIGANKDQNLTMTIGNMSAEALGVAEVVASNDVDVSEYTNDLGALAEKVSYTVAEIDGVEVGDSEVVLTEAKYALLDSTGKVVAVSQDGKEYKILDAAKAINELDTATITMSVAFGEAITRGFVSFETYSSGATTKLKATATRGIDVLSQTEANEAIETIQAALNDVSTERSKLGAVQNRLEHTIANLGVAAENLTAAESRIRDVDMAQEMMEFTRNQILIQAGTAMLANANVRPQSVLQLLG